MTERVLILEDDVRWLSFLRDQLTQAGFNCVGTQFSAEAIDIVRRDPTIRSALVDELLYVPCEPSQGGGGMEKQAMQGSDAIRQFLKARPDLQVIVITSSLSHSHERGAVILQDDYVRFRRLGAVDIFFKSRMESDPQGELVCLTRLLRSASAGSGWIPPSVSVGYGYDERLLETRRWLSPKQVLLRMRDLEKGLDRDGASGDLSCHQGILAAFAQWVSAPVARSLILRYPGSQERCELPAPRPGTKRYKMLELLAVKSVTKGELKTDARMETEIDEDEYKDLDRAITWAWTIAGVPVTPHHADTAGCLAIRRRKSARDIRSSSRQEQDSSVLRRTGDGLSVVAPRSRDAALKMQISRLRDDLGLPEYAFTSLGPGAAGNRYRPEFPLGVLFYPISSSRP